MSGIIYWRRELPPLHEEVEGEHEVEAESRHVPNDLLHRSELWGRCYPSLIEEAERRIGMEVARLRGSCAHIVDEQVVVRVNDAASSRCAGGSASCCTGTRHRPAGDRRVTGG